MPSADSTVTLGTYVRFTDRAGASESACYSLAVMGARIALIALGFTVGCSGLVGADFDHAAANGDRGSQNNASIPDGGSSAKTVEIDGSNGVSGTTVNTGSTTTTGTAPGLPMSGEVTLQHEGDGTWSAAAQFVEGQADTDDVNCTLVHQGDGCVVQKCVTASLAGIAPPLFSSQYESAGDLTVGGILGSIDLSPETGGRYVPEDGADAGMGINASGTGTIYAKGTGSAFPAFDVIASAPAALAITSPSNGTALTLSAGAPLAVTWTGQGPGTLILQLEGPSTAIETYETACRFAATNGAGTVPASVLSYLQGSAGQMVTLQGVVTTEASKTIGASTVTFDVYERVLDQDGDVYKLTTNAPP